MEKREAVGKKREAEIRRGKQWVGKVIKNLPPPPLNRKCIVRLSCVKPSEKNRGKKSAKNNGKGKKIKIGVEYVPLCIGLSKKLFYLIFSICQGTGSCLSIISD